MFDVVIIGAGVIGLSIARAIGEQTNKSVLVIEKDDSLFNNGNIFNILSICPPLECRFR